MIRSDDQFSRIMCFPESRNAGERNASMEGFIGRRDLLTPRQLQEFSVKSDSRGAWQLTSHLAALTVSTMLLAMTWSTWWMVPCFLAQGVLLNWLYCGQHELSHGTVFKTRWLNEWAGRVIGFLQL